MKKLQKAQEEYTVSADAVKLRSVQLEEMKRLFDDCRAGIFAASLKSGEPCPVCGSTEHPNPAKMCGNPPEEKEIKEALDFRLRQIEPVRYDNHDGTICYYELLLENDITEVPQYELPEGYRFVAYKDNDRDAWIDIEMSAKEFTSYEQGLEAWNRYYATRQEGLSDRMFFIETEDGEKIATATAFYDIYGRDTSDDGWLHWVAVKREYQGKGLSKPLITHVLRVMNKLGHARAKIPTQTNTWLACKVYMDLGFLPLKANLEHNYEGWKIVKALTGHRSLENI